MGGAHLSHSAQNSGRHVIQESAGGAITLAVAIICPKWRCFSKIKGHHLFCLHPSSISWSIRRNLSVQLKQAGQIYLNHGHNKVFSKIFEKSIDLDFP